MHVDAASDGIGAVSATGAMDVGRVGCSAAGSVKVTLDSGAAASCWQKALLPHKQMAPKGKCVKFVAVNGQPPECLGKKAVHCHPKDVGAHCSPCS